MLSETKRRISETALRVFAATAATLTAHGRYHEGNALLDRWLALSRGHGLSFDPRERARAPELAVARWEAVLHAAPDLPIAHYSLAAALRKHGAFERAAAVIDAALARFPDDLGTRIEAARVAERRVDPVAACAHWQQVAATPRPRPVWLASAAHVLIQLGRLDAAQALLAEARRAHPRYPGLLVAEVALANGKGEWARATALAKELHRRFPKFPAGRELVGQAIYAETLSRMDATTDAPVAQMTKAKVGRVKDDAVRELLLRFESIGDNCEFGLVQRRYGAEPLGLLRWNIVEVGDLIAALSHRLEGLGQPEYTELINNDSGEFFVLDNRWFLGMHTFLYAGQATHEELYPAMLRRIAALKERFVADLAADEKILVYRSTGLDRDTLLALHRALADLGPVRLLAVQPASPPAPAAFRGRPGEIEVVAPGLFVGFLQRLGVTAEETWNIAYEDWVSVCRKAEAAAHRAPATAALARTG